MKSGFWNRVGLVGIGLVTLEAAGPPSHTGVNVPPSDASRTDTVVVEATDRLEFRPDSIRIRTRQAVMWRNAGVIQHSVTADPSEATLDGSVHLPEGAERFDSDLLEAGETFTHVFRTPGRYGYFCIPHEGAGMTGIVIVRE